LPAKSNHELSFSPRINAAAATKGKKTNAVEASHLDRIARGFLFCLGHRSAAE